MTKQIITQKELKELLHYNPDTGLFFWRKPRAGVNIKRPAGGERAGYKRIKINGVVYSSHKLAWLYIYGEWPSDFIDHINHIRHDNRIKNIRLASKKYNAMNQSKYKNNKSGVTGVSWVKRRSKWQADIKVDRKTIHLGCFTDKFEAICVRKSAERKYGFHINHGR